MGSVGGRVKGHVSIYSVSALSFAFPSSSYYENTPIQIY